MLKSKTKNNSKNLQIKDILAKTNTLILQNINHKKQLFSSLSNFISKQSDITITESSKLLYNKELIEISGIGNGIAIPNIQSSYITKTIGIFVKLLKPIKYNSFDKEPVDLIFLLSSPNTMKSDHLKTLALISRKLSNTKIQKNIRGTSDIESIYSILTM